RGRFHDFTIRLQLIENLLAHLQFLVLITPVSRYGGSSAPQPRETQRPSGCIQKRSSQQCKRLHGLIPPGTTPSRNTARSCKRFLVIAYQPHKPPRSERPSVISLR